MALTRKSNEDEKRRALKRLMASHAVLLVRLHVTGLS